MEEFPYDYLVQAYNILAGQGHEAFLRFVNRIDMPTQDIERVLNKHYYNTKPEFRKKIDAKIKKIKDTLADGNLRVSFSDGRADIGKNPSGTLRHAGS